MTSIRIMVGVVAVSLATAPAAAAPRKATYNNERCMNDPPDHEDQMQYAGEPGAKRWVCYHGRVGWAFGGTAFGMFDCETVAATVSQAEHACEVSWSNVGCVEGPGGSIGEHVDTECYEVDNHQWEEAVCTTKAAAYGTTALIDVDPVIVSAPVGSSNPMAWHAYWDFERTGANNPRWDLISCSAVGAPPSPNAEQWTCDDKEGDYLPEMQVLGVERSDAVAAALGDWYELGHEPDINNVLCWQGDTIGWACTGIMPAPTPGGINQAMPVIHFEEENYSRAMVTAEETWGMMGIDARSALSFGCSPAGNPNTTGPKVDWYCVGKDAPNSCDMATMVIPAAADEYPNQVQNVAYTEWLKAGYSPSYGSVNCSPYPPTILPFWPLYQCIDRSGDMYSTDARGRSESEATAVAINAWGGSVVPEDAACYQTNPPRPLCEPTSGQWTRYWACQGDSDILQPMPLKWPFEAKFKFFARREYCDEMEATGFGKCIWDTVDCYEIDPMP